MNNIAITQRLRENDGVCRWTSNLATGLSLVLLAATVTQWVTGFIEQPNLESDRTSISLQRNGVHASLARHIVDGPFASQSEAFSRGMKILDSESKAIRDVHFFGFHFTHRVFVDYRIWPDMVPWTPQQRIGFTLLTAVVVPYWCFAIAFTVLPLSRVLRRARAGGKGLCHLCGYNLTANVSGTCPECGTKVRA